MNGYVHDENGHPAADVRVVVISASGYATTYTDKRGFYVFLDLPPDVYNVNAVKTGTSNAYAIGVRIHSDQTTFLSFRFSSYLRCPAFTQASLGDDQRSAQFTSLNVRQMQSYPPNVSMPIAMLPIAPAAQGIGCL